jgi:Tfp pilus assembly protein PilX
MSTIHKHSRQGGAALVIGLILLAIITLLAVVGMNISNSELASASSEQQRLRAFQTAETAVEYAMTNDKATNNDIYDVGTKCGAVKIVPMTVADGSAVNSATGAQTEKYTSRLSFVQVGPISEGFSTGTFKSVHYNIETLGLSGRGAADHHKQGTYIVNRSDNQESIAPIGTPCYVPISGSWN